MFISKIISMIILLSSHSFLIHTMDYKFEKLQGPRDPKSSPEFNENLFRNISKCNPSESEACPDQSSHKDIENFVMEKFRKEALIALKDGKLSLFDALVGEASCQIRALKIVMIYKEMLKVGIENLSNSDIEFATLAYLLTIAKEPIKQYDSDRQKLDPKRITEKYGRRPIQKIIQDAQRKLAQLSVDFIQGLTQEYQDQENNIALNYVLIDYDQARFRRPHIACYASIRFILKILAQNNVPLVILVRSWSDPLVQKLKLVYAPINGEYKMIDKSELDTNTPVVVIGGYSDMIDVDKNAFIDALNKYGIIDIILATFALHPQFTGDQRKKDIPYEQLGLKNLLDEKNRHSKLSLELGCCLENKYLMVSAHIFPSTLKLEFPLAQPS